MPHISKILIVDDQPKGQQILADLLQSADYDIHFANDGEDALAQIAQLLPDLVLLDVMMPGMNGYEVCQAIRAMPDLSQVPIVMVTALDDHASRLRGLQAGADDFISKPIDRAELRARVRTITRLNRQRRLTLAHARFDRLFELLPDGLLILDVQGAPLTINPAMRQMLGLSAEAPLPDSIFELVAEEYRRTFISNVYRALSDEEQTLRDETRLTRMDGTTFPAEVAFNHYHTEDTHAAQILVRDISARKATELETQTHLIQLNTLNTLSTALTSNLDQQLMINTLLEQVTQQLGVDAANLLLLNPESRRLEYVARRGFRTDALKYTRLAWGVGYAGQAAQEHRTIQVHDLPNNLNLLVRAPLLRFEQFVFYAAVPLLTKNKIKGVLELWHRAPMTLDASWNIFTQNLGQQAALAIDNAELFSKLQTSNANLQKAYDNTLFGWSHALDLRDHETENHAHRVVEWTLALAQELGTPPAQLDSIRYGALLHDIGKMGIPDAILLKPGPLTDEEWVIMRKHPVYAYEWLSPIEFLHDAIDIPYGHHEKWDGTGYPRGLKGEEIPLAARMFAIIDVWDALTSDRPYRPAWPREKTISHIQSLMGTHFDPLIAEVFIQMATEGKI